MKRMIKSAKEPWYEDSPYNFDHMYYGDTATLDDPKVVTYYKSFEDLIKKEYTAFDNKPQVKDRIIKGIDKALKTVGLDAYNYPAVSVETGTEPYEVAIGNGRCVLVAVDFSNLDSQTWFKEGSDNFKVMNLADEAPELAKWLLNKF